MSKVIQSRTQPIAEKNQSDQAFEPSRPLNTAVLFLVFNRPDSTKQVFEAIRKAEPPRLYVATDGPREGREGEAQKVAQVREIATAVDWPCEVKTLFREKNLGCKYAVSSAITWFFEIEEAGIILEDDCVCNHTFFRFAEEMIQRYWDEPRVMHISASNFLNQTGDVSGYTFSRYAFIWGWASWRRAWKEFDLNLKQFTYSRVKYIAKKHFRRPSEHGYWPALYLYVASGKLDTWDIQWVLSIMAADGLCVTPSVNLVSNIGFGNESTNTVQTSSPFNKQKTGQMEFPLDHHDKIEVDIRMDEQMSESIFGISRSAKIGHLKLHLSRMLPMSLRNKIKRSPFFKLFDVT